jgi:hypothetical protein
MDQFVQEFIVEKTFVVFIGFDVHDSIFFLWLRRRLVRFTHRLKCFL